MIIRVNEVPVRYYVATANGKAIAGSRTEAARMRPEEAEMVLKHLRIIDPRWKRAELVRE